MRKLLAALAISLLLAGVACASESGDEPSGGGSADGGDETGTSGTDGDEDGQGDENGQGDSDGGEAGDEEADEPAEPLGSTSTRLATAPNESTLVPVRLDVLALERLDGMIELRVAFTNESDVSGQDFAPYDAFDDLRLPRDHGNYSLSGARLVDAEAERAYLTIIDSEGACLCTSALDRVILAPGDTLEMVADFGGVPDDTEQLDVQIPHFSTVRAVPIT